MRTAVTRLDFMRNGAVLQRNRLEPGLCDFTALADGVGYFRSFSQAKTDTTFFVTNDDQGAKTEPAATFDDFGRSIDEHNFFDELAVRASVLIVVAWSARPTVAAKSATTPPARTTSTHRWTASSRSSKTLLLLFGRGNRRIFVRIVSHSDFSSYD